jgi:peptide/nickel transport system substrate-binding protein
VSHALRTSRMGVIAALAVSTIALAGCTAGSPAGDPAVADQVIVALPGDIDNFDPHTNQLNIYQYAVRDLVFSTLVKYDVALEIQPDLADYEVNDDATVLTFSIDPDAVFQDETPVDADAVIGSLERAAGTEGSIWAPRLADVASYEATDDTTVVITLNSPNAAFLAGLTDIAIIAPSNFDDVGSAPVGSGPYSFTSWEPNKQIELTRFDGYFGEKAVTETIIEQPIADQQVALNNLYSGTVDVMTTASAATVAQVDGSRATVVEPATSNSLQLTRSCARLLPTRSTRSRSGRSRSAAAVPPRGARFPSRAGRTPSRRVTRTTSTRPRRCSPKLVLLT